MTALDQDASEPRTGRISALLARVASAPIRPIVGLVVALSVAAAVVFGFRALPGLRALEAGLNDMLRVILSPYEETQDNRISVLTITEDTLALFPYRSPVDREFLAKVINVLDEAGAKAIGLDILIDQPTEEGKDQALIDAIRDYEGPLILAWADARAGLRPAQEEFLADFVERSGAVPGFATVTYDADGVVRRFNTELDDVDAGSFPVSMLRASGGETPFESGLIDWRRETSDGASAFQTVPSQTLLNPQLPSAMFKVWFGGRYVMIGADLEQTDRHQTSLAADPTVVNRTAPGVLLHAHVLSQMLDGRVVNDLNVDGAAGAIVALGAATIGVLLGVTGLSLLIKLLGLALTAAVYFAVAVWLADMGGPYLPIAPSLLALGVAFGLGGATEAVLSSREKQFIRTAFSHYLEPAMVDRLARDRDSLRLGGQRREISFLFTDVEGFTDMSERMQPEQLTSLLNEYFDGVAEVLARHDGSIDKFIGDAVVALFGALTSEEDHALNAVRCAEELDAFAEDFRRAKTSVGLGITRIGVHTGVAFVGNFGGRQRFDYTAMGDAMNTAARLENINKRLGTRVTVSSACRVSALEHASEDKPVPALRPVGRVRLKGKAEPVEVWNLDRETPEAQREAYLEAFGMLDSNPLGALSRFEHLSGGRDPLVRLHLERLRSGDRSDLVGAA